jgi:hypothetical protein
MRIAWKKPLWGVCALIVSIAPAYVKPAFAQDNSCSPIIEQLQSAVAGCSVLDSNSACYGSDPLLVFPESADFDAPGERQPVTALETIETSPNAGSALMLLHLAGEASPIKVVLFGGASLEPQNATQNIFILQGGTEGEICQQTPPGMVVRTETGERGSLTVNGVEIELGSAAYIAMTGADSMAIANLEGQVAVTVGGERQQIPVGFQSLVVGVVTGQPALAGPPTPSPLFGSLVAQFLATGLGGLRLVSESDESSQAAACGGNIALGQTITARISAPGEECLYTFCSLEGSAVSINLNRVDATVDPWVGLRMPGGALLKYNDDINEQDTNSRICNSTLPVVGCYTIVTRFDDNDTGAFRLTLNQQTACAQPTPRCEVVSLGLNQREGPGLNFPIIRTLPQGTPLRPVEGSADREWVRALVANTSQEGWVNTSDQLLACENAIPGPITAGTPPVPPTPEGPDEPPPPSKIGPFGEP